jgi:RNA polymerase sigma-70 factor (ECF subfamily)
VIFITPYTTITAAGIHPDGIPATAMTEATITVITASIMVNPIRNIMDPMAVSGGTGIGTETAGSMASVMTGKVAGTAAKASRLTLSGILLTPGQCVPARRRAGTQCTLHTAPSGVRMKPGIQAATDRTHAVPSNQHANQVMDTFLAANEDKAFYLAYAALWDREAALDVVQESMTRLVEYYRGKPPEEWPALFRTILKSRINDVRRRRLIEKGKHRLVSLTGLFRSQHDEPGDTREYELPGSERDDGITGPESEYVAAELRSRVAGALQSLSERQRQVFILREWRGMSISETAVTLGCSENSVKQHHFRAMRALRKQLAEVWEHAQPTPSRA